jgi:hypothetical protein
MALPEQIRKQTEAVQELYKQINGDSNNGEGTPADGNTTMSSDDAFNSPAADENTVQNVATPSSGNEQTTDDRNSDEVLSQKYRTLQGMYNAEVPRLHSQNKELSGRVQQMEHLLATLSAQSNAPRNAEVTSDPLITDRDQEEYGESLDVMRRVTREELIPVAQKMAQLDRLIQQLQINVVPQVNNLTQRQAVNTEQQFWTELTSYIPNWRDINNAPDFQSWLLEIDPLTGISRQTILEDAQRNTDVRRVANFFRSWMELTGQANVAQDTNRRATASELERQVTPGRSRNTGAPSNSNAKSYSPDDIKTFFNDVRQGKYKGREAERDRTERDIFAAQRENRIIVNA